MAYFSNGSAGEAFESRWCAKCALYPIVDGDPPCPVLYVHMMFNYEQIAARFHDDEQAGRAAGVHRVLSALIDDTTGAIDHGLAPDGRSPCIGFRARPHEDEADDEAAHEEWLADKARREVIP